MSFRQILCALFEVLLQNGGRKRFCWYPAGERYIVVNVVFEQVKERIVNEVNGAIDILFYPKHEFERSASFVAGESGYVDEFVVGIGNVFASFTVQKKVN